MKTVGQALLGVGFLAGAFFAVQDSDEVHWELYVPCAALMIVGSVMCKVATLRTTAQEAGASASVATLHASLDTTMERLQDLRSRVDPVNPDSMNVYDVHEHIDAELAGPLNAFAEAREAMIPRIGMSGYAEVMGSFATGERLINRSWCASADGYIDEVRACLDDAVREIGRAQLQLRELAS